MPDDTSSRSGQSADDIDQYLRQFDPLDLIRRYDVDFDIPLKNRFAVGILTLTGAMDAGTSSAVPEQIAGVGAYWCDIVRADVDYRLIDGLRQVNASQSTTESLHALWRDGRIGDSASETTAHVLARWFDGAGKIRYRLGAFTRARRGFETAATIAADAHLWWVLPDIQSNLLRAQFEEMRQAVVPKERALEQLEKLAAGLEAQAGSARDVARDHGIDVENPAAVVERQPRDHKSLEFLRGYSSLLHNWSAAVGDQGNIADSRQHSLEAASISTTLNDGYRLAQALTQQAQLAEREKNTPEALRLYGMIAAGAWTRGRQIARQNLARLRGADGVEPLRKLLKEIEDNLIRSGGSAGTDIDFHAYTIRAFLNAVRAAGDTGATPDEIEKRALEMARSVRQVVALPTYKRAYARQVQPTYLTAASRALKDGAIASGKEQSEAYGQALAFIEESTARELLDMISNATIPALGEPESLPDDLVEELSTHAVGGRRSSERRRSGMRRVSRTAEDRIIEVMGRRAQEFEAEFLRSPLEVAPHDQEISHKVTMFAANHPETGVVRYFVEDDAEGDARLSAFVIRGRSLEVWHGPELAQVSALASSLSTDRAPTLDQSVAMWELLLAEVWGMLQKGDAVRHLVLVPTDDVFSLPLHVARQSTDTPPLGAWVPMSYSVSATAFLTRGRHMLKRQAVDESDDLAAIVLSDDDVSGNEIAIADWNARRVVIAGEPPDALGFDVPPENLHTATWEGVARLTEAKPEFFVYAGHGQYVGAHAELGPFLRLRNSVVTQFDVALRLRLPRNKLAVLGACVAGQGASAGGGEVAGFLRSLMAAGAGAIALPLWSVLDESIVKTIGGLLKASRTACRPPRDGVFDVVEALHALYAEEARRHQDDPGGLAEAMPVALYL
jgi:CHAT domain